MILFLPDSRSSVTSSPLLTMGNRFFFLSPLGDLDLSFFDLDLCRSRDLSEDLFLLLSSSLLRVDFESDVLDLLSKSECLLLRSLERVSGDLFFLSSTFSLGLTFPLLVFSWGLRSSLDLFLLCPGDSEELLSESELLEEEEEESELESDFFLFAISLTSLTE